MPESKNNLIFIHPGPVMKTLITALIFTFGSLFIFPQFSSVCFAQEEEMLEENWQEEPKAEEQEEMIEEESKPSTEKNELEEMENYEEEVMEDAPPAKEERMKYYKEKYEDTFNALFEDVWQAVQKSLEDKSCQVLKKTYSQNDEGFYKGVITSDYCIFALGSDTTKENLEMYSLKVPFIRGAVWVTGRVKYKFIINENSDGTVHLRLTGEISGFEEHVTESVHFWESNGYFETMTLQRIRENLGLPAKKS